MPLSESPSRKALYLWQQPGWPDLRVNATALAPALESARMEQGRLLGVLDAIGLLPAQEVAHDLWVQEALATAQIEGQRLDMETVRSSVARRLGLDDAMPGAADRSVEGLVDVMQDAVAHCAAPLDADRLWRWQSALFPGGTSGIRRIAVGRWRAHEDPMQIVSGTLGACRAWSVDSENWPQRAQFLPYLQPNSRAIGQKDGEKWAAADNLQPTTSKSDRLPGREVVHYEAPPSHRVPQEMARFIAWFESTRPATDVPTAADAPHGLVRAAMAHLWFETVHPFEDGNGRIGRALADMALAQDLAARQAGGAGAASQPFAAPIFGVARHMLAQRAAYYDALNAAQRGMPDVTAWVLWFVQAFAQGCMASQAVVRHALDKAAFRARMAGAGVNPRQAKVLERLLAAGSVDMGGGFLGGLTADKYTKLAGTSKPTATRDLADLVAKGLLNVCGQGRGTRYAAAVPGWTQPVAQ